MQNSTCPSPHMLDVFYDYEIADAQHDEPELLLNDLLMGWSELNCSQKNFQQRPDRFEYWYCLGCGRVTEVSVKLCCATRVYKRITIGNGVNSSCWRKLIVMPDVEVDSAENATMKLRLSDYLANRPYRYVVKINADETLVVVYCKLSGKLVLEYELEKVWENEETGE